MKSSKTDWQSVVSSESTELWECRVIGRLVMEEEAGRRVGNTGFRKKTKESCRETSEHNRGLNAALISAADKGTGKGRHKVEEM